MSLLDGTWYCMLWDAVNWNWRHYRETRVNLLPLPSLGILIWRALRQKHGRNEKQGHLCKKSPNARTRSCSFYHYQEMRCCKELIKTDKEWLWKCQSLPFCDVQLDSQKEMCWDTSDMLSRVCLKTRTQVRPLLLSNNCYTCCTLCTKKKTSLLYYLKERGYLSCSS